MDQALLNLGRKAHRETVDVDLSRLEPLGFQKQLMPLAIGEPHHLVFK
jgi:hypothetical protein